MGLAAGVAVAVAVVAVAAAAYLGNRSELYSQIDQSLTSFAQPILVQAGVGGPGGGPGGGPTQGTGADNQQDHRVLNFGGDCDHGLGINASTGSAFGATKGVRQLVSPTGAVCKSPSASQIPVTGAALRLARTGHGQFFTTTTAKGQHIRVLVTGLGGLGALMVAWPLSDVDHNLRNQLILLAVIAAIGIALAALLGFLVAQAAVAPITRFTRQAERIATNPQRVEQERLDVTGNDELARLARTFNATLDALEGSIAAQRNLVADASHELRTPISTIRANLQLMRDEARLSAADRDALRSDVIEELDELTRLVGDVVELARGSKPVGEAGDVWLDQIVSQAIDRARRRGPSLTFEAELTPTIVRGEGERIARAVTNLLDNAIKWSPEGDVVEVTLHDGVLSVRDHGPGFHNEDLPFVFDRFHRAREARAKPGSGLGLAIVRQAAESHGGFVAAGNHPDGGALMRISFGAPLELPAELAATQGARDDASESSG
jgi:two-component system sensor histidine kinase MprB